MNQPTMRAKTCTPLLPSLPHKRLRVAKKKELDSENESALPLAPRHRGGVAYPNQEANFVLLLIASA